MRVLVCGGRTFDEVRKLYNALDAIQPTVVITGRRSANEYERSGADRIAAAWAENEGVNLVLYPALWRYHGRAPKAARVTEDCFALVVRQFLASPKFAGYAPSTQDLWRRYLNFAARPNCLGAISMDEIRPSIVQSYIEGLTGYTGVQAATIAALKQLERWAMVRDIMSRQITTSACPA